MLFIRPLYFGTFRIHNPVGLKLLIRLQLGLCHLDEHKFKHNFRDFLNLLCACNLEPETTFHCLLCCHLFQIEWRTLLNIKEIDENIISGQKNDLDQILLYVIYAIDMTQTEWCCYLFFSFV